MTANVAPKVRAKGHRAAGKGDYETARQLNERLYPLHRAMFADASPAPAKYALNKLHDWFGDEVRLPIAPCSDEGKAAVDAGMKSAGIA